MNLGRRTRDTRGVIRWRRFQHLGATVEYPAGTCWECTRCTICCQDTASHKRCIRILPQEVSRISLETDLKAEQFSTPHLSSSPYTHEMRKASGKCFFLRDGLCSIYDARPITCVFYPFFLNRTADRCYRFELTPEKCAGTSHGREISEMRFRRLFALAMGRLSRASEDLAF